MTDEVLSRDANDSPIGDRVASSGWPRLRQVRLVKADATGITAFAGGAVAYGPPGVPTTLVIDGQEIQGEPVIADDDYLVAEGPIIGVVEPRRAVLDDFLGLAAGAGDEAILAYASQYGFLDLAPAERPGALRAFVLPSPRVGDQVALTIGYRHAPGVTSEPLWLWRRIIREMAAVYAVAGHLHLGKTVDVADWEQLVGTVRMPGSAEDRAKRSNSPPDSASSEEAGPWILVNPRTVDGQRQALSAVLGTWLALGAVRPMMAWGEPGQDDPVITLGATTLFGGLVLELLLAVGGQPGFAICSGCGLPYVPRRRPPSGAYGAPRANYCPTCQGRKVPQNEAARRWRLSNESYFRERRARLRGA